MKRLKNSNRAFALQIILSVVLIAVSAAVLLALSFPSSVDARGNHDKASPKAGTVPAPAAPPSGACLGAEPAHLVSAFAADYSCVSLGSVPGLTPAYGGLTLKFDDPNTLLIGGAANSVVGQIYQIGVVRDANMHITGFTGTATAYPEAGSTIGQYNDGGVTFGPGNVLFNTRYPVNQIEQTKPGSTAPDKIVDLTPLGITPSVGSIGFVPDGFPGAGQMKIVSYSGGGWYTAAFSPDGNGTYDITTVTAGPVIGGGPEGIAFVPAASAVFPPNSVLVVQYSLGKVVTAPLDANGDPILASQQDFIADLAGSEGAFIDPVTGDFLFSTFGGGNQVIRVGGFQIPTTPTPTPTPEPPPLSISGTITSCPNPSAAPVADITLTITGSASGSTVSDGSGAYIFSSLPLGGSYIVTPSASRMTAGTSGAIINTVDAMVVHQHYLNVAPLPLGCPREAADINGNAVIDTLDAVAIQRFFIGRTYGIANVGTYAFHPTSRSYSGIVADQAGQDYEAVLFGDVVTAPIRPAGKAGSDALIDQSPVAGAELALPKIDLSSSATSASVVVSAIDSRDNLVGFQGEFTFDERAVRFENDPVRKAGLTNGNWSVIGNVLDGPGPIRTLRISAFSTDLRPLSGSGPLFEVRLKKVNNGLRQTELNWATGPDRFIFIDSAFKAHLPAAEISGIVTSKK